MKRCSLQNRVSKLTPKRFMRSTPALNGKTTVVCESFNTVKFLEKKLKIMDQHALKM